MFWVEAEELHHLGAEIRECNPVFAVYMNHDESLEDGGTDCYQKHQGAGYHLDHYLRLIFRACKWHDTNKAKYEVDETCEGDDLQGAAQGDR